jgi:hypothetical protein
MVGHAERNPVLIDPWAHCAGDKDTRIRDARNRFRAA